MSDTNETQPEAISSTNNTEEEQVETTAKPDTDQDTPLTRALVSERQLRRDAEKRAKELERQIQEIESDGRIARIEADTASVLAEHNLPTALGSIFSKDASLEQRQSVISELRQVIDNLVQQEVETEISRRIQTPSPPKGSTAVHTSDSQPFDFAEFKSKHRLF